MPTKPLTTGNLKTLTTLTTVTLPEGKWHTIRIAVLCFACDQRQKGNYADADHWMSAYNALKEAMEM